MKHAVLLFVFNIIYLGEEANKRPDIILTIYHIFSGSNMLGYLRCKLGGGKGEESLSNMANAYIQKSMVSCHLT